MNAFHDPTDPTQPRYYTERGAFPLEAEMRADYATVHNARKIAERLQFDDNRTELLARITPIVRRWASPPGVTGPWERLDNAVRNWQQTPRLMHLIHNQITDHRDPTMLPIDWRTALQARELTGNGTWPPSLSAPTRDQQHSSTTGSQTDATPQPAIERDR
ncbi:hypothetical protein [Nocardia sp. NPDC127526]|uniref:hypothetical protein n=1 Tax=Nocardia sp. NPDC127526 TaxID=3345393 RepID=UPI00363EC40E